MKTLTKRKHMLISKEVQFKAGMRDIDRMTQYNDKRYT